MEYRQLGYTGLRVSALALGTMTFGGRGKFALVGETEIDEARRIVERALAAGVNFIDTADVYSDGRSEEIVGEVLKGRRDEVVLATKARFAMGSGENDAGLSRRYLLRACEASLRRLGTDYIDLYQVHQRDGLTPVEETLDALDTLVHQGKVRYVGCSNHSAWHLMLALAVSERLGLQRYVTHQIYYSLLDRDAEYELVPSHRSAARDPRLEPARRRPPLGQVPAERGAAGGLAPDDALGRATGLRPGADVRHRRSPRRGGRGTRRFPGADCARLAARPSGGHVGDHRRAHRGAARRQSRCGRAPLDDASAGPARRRSARRG